LPGFKVEGGKANFRENWGGKVDFFLVPATYQLPGGGSPTVAALSGSMKAHNKHTSTVPLVRKKKHSADRTHADHCIGSVVLQSGCNYVARCSGLLAAQCSRHDMRNECSL
jgi:hypothetical protein